MIPTPELEQLIRTVQEGRTDTWEQLHRAYDRAWEAYPEQRTAHALYCLMVSYDLDTEQLNTGQIRRILSESVEVARELLQRAQASRGKDYENPFRQATFRNPAEMEAVWGKLEDISFLKEYAEQIETYCRSVAECLSVLS